MSDKPMTIQEVYAKYKHLDHVITDKEWAARDFQGHIMYDLWQVVKQAVKESVNEK